MVEADGGSMNRILRHIAVLVAVVAICGCSSDEEKHGQIYVPGPIGDLYRTCYEGATDCRDYEYDLMLYLGTSNLPNPRYSYPYLEVQGTPGAGGLWDRVSFAYYEYDEIPAGVDLPARGSQGWKVHIWGARIEYCSLCYTNNGLVRIIELSGPRDQVEFAWDPADTVALYVNRSPLE